MLISSIRFRLILFSEKTLFHWTRSLSFSRFSLLTFHSPSSTNWRSPYTIEKKDSLFFDRVSSHTSSLVQPVRVLADRDAPRVAFLLYVLAPTLPDPCVFRFPFWKQALFRSETSILLPPPFSSIPMPISASDLATLISISRILSASCIYCVPVAISFPRLHFPLSPGACYLFFFLFRLPTLPHFR